MKAALVIPLLLTGCAAGPSYTAPPEQRYVRQSWARMPVQQAEAECYHFINTAAGRGSNLYLCMKSKGYDER